MSMWTQEPTTAAEVMERARAAARRLQAQRRAPPPEPPSVVEARVVNVPPPPPLPSAEEIARWLPGTKLEPLIQLIVARRYGMTRDALLYRCHRQVYAHPRSVAMVVALRMLKSSCSRIGRAFERDHSTVFHAQRRVRDMEASDVSLSAEIEDIAREVAHRAGLQWASISAQGAF